MEDIDFFGLPTEIKNIIAEFLDDRSRRMIRTTNTEWYNRINYDDFTIYFARPSTLPDLIQTFNHYSKPIGLKFKKTASIDKSFIALATLTNLTRLEVEPSTYRQSVINNNTNQEDLHRFTALTALGKLRFVGKSFTLYLRKYFPNLTHLMLQGSDYRVRNNVISKLGNITQLRSLNIHDSAGALVFDEESVSKMSNVSKVSIVARHLSFPFSKLPNLESLVVANTTFDDFSANTKLTRLSVNIVQDPLLTGDTQFHTHDYQQISALENMKELQLCLHINEHEYKFLSKLTSLENLRIYTDADLTGQFLQFISSSKLTSLEVTAPINYGSISHMTSLQHLNYYVASDDTKEIRFKLTNVTSLKVNGSIMISKCCPNVKSLNVNHKIGPNEYKILAGFSQLESLQLSSIIDNTALQIIVGCTKLTQLSAMYDQVSTYQFDVLTNLTALKDLSLNPKIFRSKIKQIGLLPALRKLPNLERLELFYFGVDDEYIETLTSLTRLTYLGFRADPDELDELKLSKLTNLQILHRFKVSSKPWPTCKLKNMPYLYEIRG